MSVIQYKTEVINGSVEICKDENGNPIIEWKKYEGKVLGKGEHNYYDDSDFVAYVFDPDTESYFEHQYDTTRGGWSGQSVVVDATDEVKAAYRAYLNKRRHEHAVKKARLIHSNRLAAKQYMGVTFNELRRLTDAYGLINDEGMIVIGKLLHTKNFRSEFRKSMADKVREWLSEENPKYKKPLSDNQFRCCVNPHYRGDAVAPWSTAEYRLFMSGKLSVAHYVPKF